MLQPSAPLSCDTKLVEMYQQGLDFTPFSSCQRRCTSGPYASGLRCRLENRFGLKERASHAADRGGSCRRSVDRQQLTRDRTQCPDVPCLYFSAFLFRKQLHCCCSLRTKDSNSVIEGGEHSSCWNFVQDSHQHTQPASTVPKCRLVSDWTQLGICS